MANIIKCILCAWYNLSFLLIEILYYFLFLDKTQNLKHFVYENNAYHTFSMSMEKCISYNFIGEKKLFLVFSDHFCDKKYGQMCSFY